MSKDYKYIKASDSKSLYKNSYNNYDKVLSDGGLHVSDDIRSVFNPGQFIFSEISNLRLEVSRLGVLVRINNEGSPAALRAYHSHIMSLLIPCSVIINAKLWTLIDKLWNETEDEINKFEAARKSIPNKKIPKELIIRLDRLYRISLLAGQKAGLGLQVERVIDIDDSLEKAITG